MNYLNVHIESLKVCESGNRIFIAPAPNDVGLGMLICAVITQNSNLTPLHRSSVDPSPHAPPDQHIQVLIHASAAAISIPLPQSIQHQPANPAPQSLALHRHFSPGHRLLHVDGKHSRQRNREKGTAAAATGHEQTYHHSQREITALHPDYIPISY